MKRWVAKFSVLAVLCPILFFPAALSAQESLTAATAAEYEEGLVHTVVKGDTLWDLSGKYLGSPWVWPELWERNRFLTNPHYIYPGIKIVVYPPPPREYVMEVREPAREAVSVAAAEPSEEGTAQPGVAAPSVDVPPERPTLQISQEDFVSAGEFTPERPSGIGYIKGGEQDKIAFSEEDKVYLSLDKEIPEDQILGVYRVRGPVHSPAGRPVSGYVRFLVGILQVTGKQDDQVLAVVRKSFADMSREDLIREEIPSYSPVYLREEVSGVEAFVITGKYPKKALATEDFVYLDRGADAGVAVGDVFRLYDRRGRVISADWDKEMENVRIPVGNAVIVRVLKGSATAYVTSTTQAFPSGAVARSGPAESP
jgi:LysM repeat protein